MGSARTADQRSGQLYQPEIDGLRAIAILVVIIHHYFPALLPNGFVGVDIFFVISGYVITLHLRRTSATSWSEYLLGFYARRVKRLLPALLLCIAITTIVFVAVTTRPQPEIFKTGALSLLGASNLYLLRIATDYFSLQAQLNPFTQTWSLGVEEQFYALFPLILAMCGYARIKSTGGDSRAIRVLFLISSLSLAGFIILSYTHPKAAFYLMPTRFWELGLGALVAIMPGQKVLPASLKWRPEIISTVAFLGLTISCFLLPGQPMFAVILSTLSATVLISLVKSRQSLPRFLTFGPVIYIGLISYSLYLWHWSILVLGKWTIGVGAWSAPILLLLTVLIAAFSYHLVEKPLRYARWSGTNLKTILYGVVPSVIFAVFSATVMPKFAQNFNDTLPGILGVHAVTPMSPLKCHSSILKAKLLNPIEECLHASRTVEKPRAMYLIGDSHAAQLVPMVTIATNDLPFEVRFMSTLGETGFPIGLINQLQDSRQTLDYIVQDSLPGDVVLIAFHKGYLNEKRDMHVPMHKEADMNAQTTRFVESMRPYIDMLTSKRVQVILIRDTPLMRVVATSPSCYLQIKMFGQSICKVDKKQDLHTRKRQDLAYDTLASSNTSVMTWDPLPYMYGDADTLEVVDGDGNYLMWNWNHISAWQSEQLAPSFAEFLSHNLDISTH